MKYLSTLIKLMIVSTILSLILFFRGVFIDRYYIKEKAYGKVEKMAPVVMLVIDSFRMDLAVSQYFSFINKRKQDEEQSLLFLSLAETPSVTGPRIQTMTTGNFAPLTKVLDNFHDSEILEDSFIAQSKLNGKKTLFIGDNNWLGLYPNEFTFAYPLNKMKINTEKMYIVDKKFEEIFYQNFEKQFDLSIIHFLGLDFVAHEYSRVWDNKVLQGQLEQLSQIIERIYNKISNETTLIITGDHGMLNDGNHGGNSTWETNTVFFVCRKNGKFNKRFMQTIRKNVTSEEKLLIDQSQFIRTIKQIDIAPTLAKLIGVPIPFSNIGIFVPEIFSKNRVDEYCLENLQQMIKYVKTIKSTQGLFSYSQIKKWKKQLNNANNCKEALPIMEDIQYQSRIIWNNYNSTLIILSLSFAILTCILFITTIVSLKYVKDFTIDLIYCEQMLRNIFTFYKFYLLALICFILVAIYFVDFEIISALFLNVIMLALVFYSLIYLNRSIQEYQNNYLQINALAQNHVSKQSQLQYLNLFIIVIFLHKIYRQGSLIFSIDSQRIEQDSLFDQIIDLLLICFVLNVSSFIKEYYDQQQKQKLLSLIKQSGQQLLLLTLSIIFLKIEYLYFEQSQDHPFQQLSSFKQTLHIYFPCFLQQVLLYYYQKQIQANKYQKIIGHFSLLLLHSYFIIHQQPFISIQSQNITNYLKAAIFSSIIFFVFTKDIIYLLISAQIATTQYGIAIYTYSICSMITIYLLLKPQIKINKIIFVALIAVFCQYLWLMIGNNCTISSVQNATQRIRIHPQNSFELVLIIILMLAGPYFCGCTILKFVGIDLQNEQEESKLNQDINVHREIKLQFLLNFFIQVLFTEFHNYNNLGGLTKIQFKYIFDVVGYIVMCLLMYIY